MDDILKKQKSNKKKASREKNAEMFIVRRPVAYIWDLGPSQPPVGLFSIYVYRHCRGRYLVLLAYRRLL
jgi:hypothetical protein